MSWSERRVIVSVHDVAPPFEADIRAQLRELDRIGVDRVVLKVVPNWHGAHALSRSESLSELVRERCDRASQIVLHGYDHCPHGPWIGSPVRRARAALFAPTAAEFMTRSYADALDALHRGIEEFSLAGIPRVSTFCAPAWLLTDAAQEAVANSGFRYLVGMFSIRDLQTEGLRLLPAQGYMGAVDRQELGINVLNQIVRISSRRAATMKIFLHPDPTDRNRWMSTIRLLEAMLRNHWQPATVEDLFHKS